MSSKASPKRRVLIIGPKLAPIAETALPNSDFEAVSPDDIDAATLLHSAIDLVLIEAGAADPARLTTMIAALAQMDPQPAAVLVGANLPAGLARALFKLRRSDVLDMPLSPNDLARCVAGLFADEAASGGAHHSKCWSVMSAVGGAGGTTIAIEIAAALANRTLGDRVGFFDLNLADGAASAYLGAAPNMHLADASATPERIDAALLDAYSLRAPGGFDLFACPRDPYAFANVTPAAVCRLLEVACQVDDWLIIDLPRHRHSWTLDVLAGSDELIVVSELTVPALLAARDLTAEIEAEVDGAKPPHILLNRMATRMFGPAPSRAEAERALGRKVSGMITSDWEAAACSANLGGPIIQHRPRSKIVKDIATLIDDLSVKPPIGNGKPGSAKTAHSKKVA
jgi:pilus assembly protein CpaE